MNGLDQEQTIKNRIMNSFEWLLVCFLHSSWV